jgi:hypothetical protein
MGSEKGKEEKDKTNTKRKRETQNKNRRDRRPAVSASRLVEPQTLDSIAQTVLAVLVILLANDNVGKVCWLDGEEDVGQDAVASVGLALCSGPGWSWRRSLRNAVRLLPGWHHCLFLWCTLVSVFHDLRLASSVHLQMVWFEVYCKEM